MKREPSYLPYPVTDRLIAGQQRLQLEQRQQHEAEAMEEKLKAFYPKDLEEVKAKAWEMRRTVEARGVLPSIRRFWPGEKAGRNLPI